MTYVDSFSYEWLKFRTTQLDSKAGNGESRVCLERMFGFPLEQLRGKRVLDVGCGTGRYVEVVAPYASEVVGIDYSDSVYTARANTNHLENVVIFQEDIKGFYKKMNDFDVVYSVGVLHHTPNPKEYFMDLAKCVKQGGTLMIWMYGKGGLLNTLQKPALKFWRFVSKHLPLNVVCGLCYLAVPLWYVYKVFPPIILLFPFERHPRWENRVLNTFDAFTPTYVNTYTYVELFDWFREAGFNQLKAPIGGANPNGKVLFGVRLTRENPSVVGVKM